MMVALLLFVGQRVLFAEVFQSLALIQNIGLPPNRLFLNFPSWSISVEIWISILFFFVLQKRSAPILVPSLFIGIVGPIVLYPRYISGDASNIFTYLNCGLLRGIAGFSAGSIAFMAFNRWGKRFELSSALWLYGLIAVLSYFFISDNRGVMHWLMFYATLIMTLTVLAANDNKSIFATPPFVFLGTISYSIYLLHVPIYNALNLLLGDELTRGIGKGLVLACVLAISYASYRWVERPSQNVIVRSFDRFRKFRMKSLRDGVPTVKNVAGE